MMLLRSAASRKPGINLHRGFWFQSTPTQKTLYGQPVLDILSRRGGLRDIEVEAVTKMLVCGTRISGVKEHGCNKSGCPHVKYITNSCHSRA